MKPRSAACATALTFVACAGGGRPAPEAAAPEVAPVQMPVGPAPRAQLLPLPVLAPQLAMLAGLLPLRTIGADSFRVRHPTFDGRGVVIGILDTGVDPGLPGLSVTTTGEPTIADLRDFAAEGRIDLEPVTVEAGGVVSIGGHRLSGLGRVARLATPPYLGGLFHERALGAHGAADVNQNGVTTDEYPVIVARASDGWFVMTDTDGDGSLDNERALRDFAVQRDTFSYHAPGAAGLLTMAVNLDTDTSATPVVGFVFDNSGHGSHVAGIAAGHDLFGVKGFDGVAPGARILALKIANNARGSISVSGSILRAMNYAADYAERRGLALVLNLSWNVGNEAEGSAAIDSLIDQFVLKHPAVPIVISAGNDGPGISTLGFPGSAEFGISVCALFPAAYPELLDPNKRDVVDVVGSWSARGGELAKPDLCAPGVAFSNVPRWRTGGEVLTGTSMAAPHVTGAIALLQSALAQSHIPVRGIDVKQALMATADPLPGMTTLDQGAGVPNVGRAYRWLHAAHQVGIYRVRALAGADDSARGSAAYRRSGLLTTADTIQRFVITSVGGQAAARLLLRSDVPWVRAPKSVNLSGQPETVTVTYGVTGLRAPGLHVGTVWARSASDTLAGPVLGLTNVVIVPNSLTQPLATRGLLAAGQVARHFLTVPGDGGGLNVTMHLPNPDQRGTLFLFEPGGQPHRGVKSQVAGGDDPATVQIEVRADDVVPGVYEAVVAAPPTERLNYELRSALPAVAVRPPNGMTPMITVGNRAGDSAVASIVARVIGAARSYRVEGAGGPDSTTLKVPLWAVRMVADVRLTRELWNALTDFGLTIYDSAGSYLAERPLDYAIGRFDIPLDSAIRGRSVVIELFPAFARSGKMSWNADLRVSFLQDSVSATAALTAARVPPRTEQSIELTLPGGPNGPPGFDTLYEVRVRSVDGAESVVQFTARGDGGSSTREPLR